MTRPHQAPGTLGATDIEYFRLMPSPRLPTFHLAVAHEIPLLAFSPNWTPDELWEVLGRKDIVMPVLSTSSAGRHSRRFAG